MLAAITGYCTRSHHSYIEKISLQNPLHSKGNFHLFEQSELLRKVLCQEALAQVSYLLFSHSIAELFLHKMQLQCPH